MSDPTPDARDDATRPTITPAQAAQLERIMADYLRSRGYAVISPDRS